MKKGLKIFLGIILLGIIVYATFYFSWWAGFSSGYSYGVEDSLSNNAVVELSNDTISEIRLTFLDNCINYLCGLDELDRCEGTDKINEDLLNGLVKSQEEYNERISKRYSDVNVCVSILNNRTQDVGKDIENYFDNLPDKYLKKYLDLPIQ